MTHDDVPAGGVEMGEDPPWDAWRPEDIARRLAGVDARWYVADGWALDLFRGQVTREHEDLEIAMPAGQFGQADFAGVLPLLSPLRRAWLTAALERAHPGHSWIADVCRA